MTRNLDTSTPSLSPATEIPDASWAIPKIPLSSLISYVVCCSAVPLGFVVNYSLSDPTIVFCVNFIAIFPSATILSTALHDLNLRLGQRLGALLNQTLGYGHSEYGQRTNQLTILQQHSSANSFCPSPQVGSSGSPKALDDRQYTVESATYHRTKLPRRWPKPCVPAF